LVKLAVILSNRLRCFCGAENRELVLDALSVLGEDSVPAQDGAIYFLAKLPDGMDDEEVVRRLVTEYRVTTIPGSACGMPGYIRVAYANVTADACREACNRLRQGLADMIAAHTSS
jgi:aromatic aminotransferase